MLLRRRHRTLLSTARSSSSLICSASRQRQAWQVIQSHLAAGMPLRGQLLGSHREAVAILTSDPLKIVERTMASSES
eukprot:1116715-Pyramimonas_sp.AAC.1